MYHRTHSFGGKDEKFKSKNIFYVPDGFSGGLFYCFTGGRSLYFIKKNKKSIIFNN